MWLAYLVLSPGNYHIYLDETTYKYDVTLARVDLLTNKNERYMLKVCEPFPRLHHPNSIFSTPTFASIPLPFRPRAHIRRPNAQRLQLYESHGTPKLYACFEKYSAPGATTIASVLAPIGSSFDVAFDHFKKFFVLKTGMEWEDRLVETVTSKEKFVFVRPKVGQPKGVLLGDALNEAGLDNFHPMTDKPMTEEAPKKALPVPSCTKFHDLCYDLCDDYY